MQQKQKNDKKSFRTAFTEKTSTEATGILLGAFSKIFMGPTEAHFWTMENFMIKVFCRNNSRLSTVEVGLSPSKKNSFYLLR